MATLNPVEVSSISPFFIVKNVAAAFELLSDKLGFEVVFQAEPDDLFFGIVKHGGAMIFLKDVGVSQLPNHMRDVNKGTARWDAYVHVPDPDALAEEFTHELSNSLNRWALTRLARIRIEGRRRLRSIFRPSAFFKISTVHRKIMDKFSVSDCRQAGPRNRSVV